MTTPLQSLLGGEHEAPEQSLRLVEVADEEAEEVFDALGSATARRLLAALQAEPRPPAALAEDLDVSLQTVHYHLRRFREAELVTVAGTRYSEKGVEMDVYAAAADPLVVSAAGEQTRSRLRGALERLFGAVAAAGALLGRDAGATPGPVSGIGAQGVAVVALVVGELLTLGGRVPSGYTLFALLVLLWALHRSARRRVPQAAPEPHALPSGRGESPLDRLR